MRGPWLAVLAMGVVVVLLLVVLVLRGGGDDVDVEDLLADAPAAVDAEGTARLAMSVEVAGEGVDVSVEGEGGVDFATGAGWFTVELLGRQIEMRSNAETLFVRPVGEEAWVAVHADEAAESGALDSLGTGPSEAGAFVDLLRGDPSDIEDLGEEEIDGEPVRHLRLTIDLASAIEAADESHRGPLEELGELAPEDGQLPLEVWIDERNLPVRQRLEGEVQGIGLLVTVDLSDWGAPLEVAIPPEGEVRDVEPEELALLFGGAAP
jgi:hypothetical protein